MDHPRHSGAHSRDFALPHEREPRFREMPSTWGGGGWAREAGRNHRPPPPEYRDMSSSDRRERDDIIVNSPPRDPRVKPVGWPYSHSSRPTSPDRRLFGHMDDRRRSWFEEHRAVPSIAMPSPDRPAFMHTRARDVRGESYDRDLYLRAMDRPGEAFRPFVDVDRQPAPFAQAVPGGRSRSVSPIRASPQPLHALDGEGLEEGRSPSAEDHADTSSQALERLEELEEEIARCNELLQLIRSQHDAKPRDQVLEYEDEQLTQEEFMVEIAEVESIPGCDSDDDGTMEIWEVVVRENKRKARQTHRELTDILDSKLRFSPLKRVYTSTNDYDFSERISVMPLHIRHAARGRIRRRFSLNAKKRRSLMQEYKARWDEWIASKSKIEDAIEDERQNTKRRRKQGKSGGTTPVRTPSTSVSLEGLGSGSGPITFTRASRRNATFTSDAVRTEAEYQYALAMLTASVYPEDEDDPTDHDPARSAVEPPMVLDPMQKELCRFRHRNDYVDDPVHVLQRYNAELDMIWTDEERAIFRDKLQVYGKCFHKISPHLPVKTTSQCVTYYYREKFRLEFPALLKKPAVRGGKRRGPAGKKGGKPLPIGAKSKDGATDRDTPTSYGSAAESPVPLRMKDKDSGGNKDKPDKDESVRTENGRRSSRFKSKAPTDEADEDVPEVTEKVTSTNDDESGVDAALAGKPVAKEKIRQHGKSRRKSGGTLKEESRRASPTLEQFVLQEAPAGDLPVTESIEPAPSQGQTGPVKQLPLPHITAALVDSPAASPSEELNELRVPGIPEKRHYRRRKDLNVDTTGHGEDESHHPKRTISYWNNEETTAFHRAYVTHGRDWDMVAKTVGSKSAKQALNFYRKHQKELDALLDNDEGGKGPAPIMGDDGGTRVPIGRDTFATVGNGSRVRPVSASQPLISQASAATLSAHPDIDPHEIPIPKPPIQPSTITRLISDATSLPCAPPARATSHRGVSFTPNLPVQEHGQYSASVQIPKQYGIFSTGAGDCSLSPTAAATNGLHVAVASQQMVHPLVEYMLKQSGFYPRAPFAGRYDAYISSQTPPIPYPNQQLAPMDSQTLVPPMRPPMHESAGSLPHQSTNGVASTRPQPPDGMSLPSVRNLIQSLQEVDERLHSQVDRRVNH
ncbi:hypothetical protein HDU85_000152 [Gaertneriomyces sp. JEL0708]|nr:hypothetical protein HDU85_000152 [Gaertneriomyces sp. JEL0708]